MSRYELTPLAAADLLGIVRYTGQKWGQAQHYREELYLALQQLSLTSNVGRLREGIAPGLRSFPIAQHVAFYVQRKGKVVILRILHPRMNVDEALQEQV